MIWFEEQKKNLYCEEKGILDKVKMLFTKMNLYAAKMGRKLHFKHMEEEETQKDLKGLDQLLNQL